MDSIRTWIRAWCHRRRTLLLTLGAMAVLFLAGMISAIMADGHLGILGKVATRM